MEQKLYKRSFWSYENLAFAKPHFRLEKCARLLNSRARGRECDLLDLGCGPGTLAILLDRNIHYYGIDIAIQKQGPNFLELDLLQNKIAFRDLRFDFVVASGVFEYMSNQQTRKFSEIKQILKDGAEFIVSYSNVRHWRFRPDQPWNNVQTIAEFRKDLESCFRVKRFFASSHNRLFYAPGNRLMKRIQMRLNLNIPFISPMLAVEYFFICSAKRQ